MKHIILGCLLLTGAAIPSFAALKEGDRAPEFKTQASLAGKEFTFSLHAALKKGPVVVYFYPAAFTGGCNLQAHTFAEDHDKFAAAGATVVGVSLDSISRLNDFSADPQYCAGKLPVAADEKGEIAKSYDLKITDIYEQCSIDYSRNAEITQIFFKTVQNKLHWAITGKTAAELIADRAQADQPNMGLKTWKNAPQGRIQKADVSIAKNYLEEKEIKALERIVTMYLDYAENQAARQIPMTMADWVEKLDAFLKFNDYEVLTSAGKVSHEVAKELAEQQYESFRIVQDRSFESDFERASKKMLDQKRLTQREKKPGKK